MLLPGSRLPLSALRRRHLASAVTHKIIAARGPVAIVGRAALDDGIALPFREGVDEGEKVFEGVKLALWRRKEGIRRLWIWLWYRKQRGGGGVIVIVIHGWR